MLCSLNPLYKLEYSKQQCKPLGSFILIVSLGAGLGIRSFAHRTFAHFAQIK